MSGGEDMSVPPPSPAPDEQDLPHALTFFVTEGVRRRVLAALRELDADRVRALCLALDIDQ